MSVRANARTRRGIYAKGDMRKAVEEAVGEMAEIPNIGVDGGSEESDATAHLRGLRDLHSLHRHREVRGVPIARHYLHLHPTRRAVKSV